MEWWNECNWQLDILRNLMNDFLDISSSLTQQDKPELESGFIQLTHTLKIAIEMNTGDGLKIIIHHIFIFCWRDKERIFPKLCESEPDGESKCASELIAWRDKREEEKTSGDPAAETKVNYQPQQQQHCYCFLLVSMCVCVCVCVCV